MMLRARHLVFAWLAYGALQLALLGVPAASGQPAIGGRDARSQSATQTVAVGKWLLAPDLSDRRAPTPFAPSAYVRLELATVVRVNDVTASPCQATAVGPSALPPARAPPALA